VGIEDILGITMLGGRLRIDPCIPREWRGFEAEVRTASARIRIVVENPAGVNRGVRRVELDGVEQAAPEVPLTGHHEIRVVLG